MVVVDTTALSLLFVPGAQARTADGRPIKFAKERLVAFVEQSAASNQKLIIPTPALSEFLVKAATRVNELLAILKTSPWFRIESFDAAAAVELAIRTARAIADGDKREGSKGDWAKVKFDRKIVAIALACGANTVFSDDGDMKAIGARWGISVLSIEDLPIPDGCNPPPLLENAFPETDAAG